jgi:hypothetical protein
VLDCKQKVPETFDLISWFSSLGICAILSERIQYLSRPESSKDRKEAKRAKATRLAAVHVASESGIPADRGSFGA